MAQIIDGKAVSANVKQQVADECAKLFNETGKKPGLAVIIVGDDPASRVYVNNKKKHVNWWVFVTRICYACTDNTRGAYRTYQSA